MSHLICFIGRNGSGKTYRANQLVKNENYVKISMSDSLRELAWKTLGRRPESDKEYDKFKNRFICDFEISHSKDYGVDYPFMSFEITGRQFLQNLGQGCKDLFGEDFWVKQWEKSIQDIWNTPNSTLGFIVPKDTVKFSDKGYITVNSHNNIQPYSVSFMGCNVTTDDIRFPIEVESAHKLGATFIWCDYQKGNYPIEEHSSEVLANRILASGKFKDGDEISFEELKTFFN